MNTFMFPIRVAAFAIFLTAASPLIPAFGQSAFAQETRVERLRFAPGASSKQVRDSIVGYESVQYRVAVLAGQRMSVRLGSDNRFNFFNVGEAGNGSLFNSSNSSDDSFTFTVPSSGDYVIDVYLMRNAARRNEEANFTLDVAVAGGSVVRPRPVPDNDFADGLTGGPDFWRVTNVPPGDKLNVRLAPSGKARIVARLNNGARLRNLGCAINGNTRWCRVQTAGGRTGWVAGRFLRE